MIKIYNTFSRKKEDFIPIVEGHVGIYVCGPTVYGMPHLGHAKSYINFDTIIRYLKFAGFKVKYVQNITDVGHLVGDGDSGEDKIAKQAIIEKLDAFEIAYKYEIEYFKNMDKLNVMRPSVSCRATGFIMEMIETVKEIIEKGYGYVTKEGNVYFNVRKYSNYGQLSNRKLDDAVSGERIELADDKHDPADFALWKKADPDVLMQWPSPWGSGCPGWHLECTTLGKKFLGEKFDIHGGGLDNIFPHHECECAQADVVCGHLPMNYFMHNGLVTINGTKMGKSLGNFITLPDLFKKFNPMAIRFFIEQFHYRSNVDFSDEGLKIADKQFNKLKENILLIKNITDEIANEITDNELKELFNNFIEAMNEDFNTPLALVEFNKLNKIIPLCIENSNKELAKQINLVVEKLGVQVLGLVFEDNNSMVNNEIPLEVVNKAALRWINKQNRNWAESDKLREEVKVLGYIINDKKDGYEIEKI